DLIREFLSSGHVSADKAIHLYGQQNTYRFPQHEFFKGAILGQRKYYREEESKVLNLYDSKLSSSFLRLLRLKILSVLVQKSTLATYEGDDFEEITNILYQIGISSQDVFKAMNDLLNKNLIWTNDRLALTNNSKILPNRLGGYMYKEMSHRFMYFEPCVIDSSIYDEQIWSELKQITEQIEETTGLEKIKLRIERARIFTRNIENIENNWLVKSCRYKLPPEWSYNCVSDYLKPKLESEFNRVLDSASNQLNKK
ncbi:MAG: hypothetical protein Q8M94_04720, partial [Ignavibacteria bacterium]|nr:hypothetical protein [Ignavibacteria bacterium]